MGVAGSNDHKLHFDKPFLRISRILDVFCSPLYADTVMAMPSLSNALFIAYNMSVRSPIGHFFKYLRHNH